MTVQVLYRALSISLALALPAMSHTLCNGDYVVAALPAETPSADFIDHGDGTVTHRNTGLMWKRCSEGQQWNGQQCTGTAATFTWAAAQRTAETANSNREAGHSNWRVPSPTELRTIVETRCWNPAVNADIFPNTPPNWFWSAAPYTGNDLYAWEVGFLFGDVSPSFRSSELRVRLVRHTD